MIVIGIDPHKRTHTAVAIAAGTGEVLAERAVSARERGHGELLAWARSFAGERLFALEDCRHVSAALERFLVLSGERVVRVPPRAMAGARRGGRTRGKSDAIDALAVAHASLREPDLPLAKLAGEERELALLLDHHDDLVQERTRMQNRLRWHLHDLDPSLEIPAGALDRGVWLRRAGERLGTLEGGLQVELARELIARIGELTRRVRELTRELERRLRAQAEPLLAVVGCGPLTAAKLLAEVAGVGRFSAEAKLAKHAGSAPLEASSGERRRHRLNRSGNRQLNCALHRIAITQARVHPPARDYLARKQAEGKSRREALRCLKRHLARVVYRTLRAIEEEKMRSTTGPVRFPALT